jgi:spore coat protein U-like protein
MNSVRLALLLSVLSLGAMSTHCQSEAALPPAPGCPSDVSATQFSYLLPFGATLRQVGSTDNRVINSDSVYRALYAGVNYTPPPIDFTTHTLLFGKLLLSTSGQSTGQHVTKTCTGSYTYAVQLTRGVGQAYMEVSYHAVVEKLPTTALINFQVQVLP